MSDPPSVRGDVRGCGFGDARDLKRRFSFICPMTWAQLSPTEDGAIRVCDVCQTNVHRCDTMAEFEERARTGDCVYASPALMAAAERKLTEGYLGRPDPIEIWSDKLFPPASGSDAG